MDFIRRSAASSEIMDVASPLKGMTLHYMYYAKEDGDPYSTDASLNLRFLYHE